MVNKYKENFKEKHFEDLNFKNLSVQLFKKYEGLLMDIRNYIHFSSENLETYSLNCADIIISCNIHSEALLKYFYNKNFNDSKTKKDKDTIEQAFKKLDEKYSLSKKKVCINPEINLLKYNQMNENFSPLQNKNESRNDSGKIFTSLKHDFTKNIHKATLGEAIKSVAALGILTYYCCEISQFEYPNFWNFFSPKVASSDCITYYIMSKNDNKKLKKEFEECVIYDVPVLYSEIEPVAVLSRLVDTVSEEEIIKNPTILREKLIDYQKKFTKDKPFETVKIVDLDVLYPKIVQIINLLNNQNPVPSICISISYLRDKYIYA